MTLQTLDTGFARQVGSQTKRQIDRVPGPLALPYMAKAVFVQIGQVIAKTYASVQRQRRRNKNLRHALTLDGATLRDLGLNKADILAMCDGHLPCNQQKRAAAGMLAIDHDLTRSWNSDALEQLALMDDRIR